MAGDPSLRATRHLLGALPAAGADVIELGMPFSDPMADGPIIQAAGVRALQARQTLAKTLGLVAQFRKRNATTPIVLMGYYNPVYRFGVPKFLRTARQVGVDGLIIVDLPPEEDEELCLPAQKQGLAFARLLTPTSDARRLPFLLKNASGFLYYVAVTGVTGTKRANVAQLQRHIARIKHVSPLPLVTGFGITQPIQARQIAQLCDGVVVGSALVQRLAQARSQALGINNTLAFARQLSHTIHRSK